MAGLLYQHKASVLSIWKLDSASNTLQLESFLKFRFQNQLEWHSGNHSSSVLKLKHTLQEDENSAASYTDIFFKCDFAREHHLNVIDLILKWCKFLWQCLTGKW